MMLYWSYNYHANNMCQQIAPTEIYVKKRQQPICGQETTISCIMHHGAPSSLAVVLLWEFAVTRYSTVTKFVRFRGRVKGVIGSSLGV